MPKVSLVQNCQSGIIALQSARKVGILENAYCRVLFEKINGQPFCGKCRSERRKFLTKDRKGHDSYSNLVPGFSSEKINIPIDVLIVGEAHGGGEDNDFRKQKGLDFEGSKMTRFYREPPDKSFHQQQVRLLLDELDSKGLVWVFTDLIKCFVWHGFDKKRELDGRKNWEIAIRHCCKYLGQQMDLLQPRKILGLGGAVAEYFRLHGPERSIYVSSIFPSRWTADLWVAQNGWEPVIPKLVE